MPRHRMSQVLPSSLRMKVAEGKHSHVHGNVHTISGGGIAGARIGLVGRPHLPNGGRAPVGAPRDVQYSLKGGIITRTEFVRGEPSIPVHMAHFDAGTGKRFSTILDCF